ncbi:MAG: hypothetical protein ACSLFH_12865 [Desulfuromonadales bacterium]
MKGKEISDPVSLIIKKCLQGEDEANRIYHLLAEERQHHIILENKTVVHLSEEQLGEFVERFSSEVKPTYWVSKRLKH